MFKYHDDIQANFTDPADPADATLKSNLKGWRVSVGARAWYNINDNMTLLPWASYTHVHGDIKHSVNVDAGADVFGVCGGACTSAAVDAFNNDSNKAWYNGIEIGSGLEYHADKVLVVGSAWFDWNRTTLKQSNGESGNALEENKLTMTNVTLPTVALGVEYAWKPMVTFRGGIETTTIFDSNSTEGSVNDGSTDLNPDQSEKSKYSYQDTQGDLGIGLHFGNLTLDTVFGGLVVGNYDYYNSYFSKISFVYNFK